MQILVVDLWERIEAAEKLGAEARQYKMDFYFLFHLLFSFERMLYSLVTIARRSHAFPYRTRKLSFSAPMVVGVLPL